MQLTRRKVLVTLLVVGLSAAAAGAGTMALFSDTESSTGNTVQAGTLDLVIDGDDNATTTVDVDDAAPGDRGTGSATIANTGSLDGSVDVNFRNVTFAEHEAVEAEGDTTEPGDLNVTVSVYVDDDGNLSTTGDQSVVVEDAALSAVDAEYDVNHTLNSGEQSHLVVEWAIPATEDNDAQGDDVHFDLEAELNQKDSQ